MDQISLVDSRIDDGRRLLLQLTRDGFDVTAAFWLRLSEETWWHLYIASKQVDERGPAEAYREVQKSLRQLAATTISLSDVKLIGASSPLTRDALKIRKRSPAGIPIRSGGARLGTVVVEELLIYPPVEDGMAEKAYVTADVVTCISMSHGKLTVEKKTVYFPKHESPFLPVEWVADAKIVDNQLLVKKAKLQQGPEGLLVEYRDEISAPCGQ
jgi:hypothetical protein